MSISRVAIGCFVLIVVALAAQRAPAQMRTPDERTQRMDRLRKIVQQHIASFEQESAKPGTRLDPRPLVLYARYVLALNDGGAVEKASGALKRMLPLQEMNPSSPKFGEFIMSAPAQPPEGAAPEAGIAPEVVVLPLCEIVMTYGDKLSPELRETLVERIKAGLAAMKRRPVLPSDASSGYLIGVIAQLLGGEVARDDKALAEAESRLTNFISVARTRGIAEYVSPTFTGVQLGVILTGQQRTTQPSAKRMLDALAQYLWSQIAANVVPVRGVLGGPHSRDFDFIFGSGVIDSFLFLEGLRNQPPPVGSPFNDGLRAFANEVERGFHPSDSILALSASPEPGHERLVRQRWGAATGADRYFYLTPDYAIGSSSQVASAHDRKLTIEFVTRKPLPAIWYVADPFDAPYGQVKRAGRTLQPSHWREQIAAVQEKGVVLALMNLRADMRNSPKVPITLASNVLIPLGADEVWIDGKQAPGNSKNSFEMPATVDSTVFVREGAGACAIKFFAIDGAFGDAPTFALKYDGNPFGVARFIAYHFRITREEKPQRSEKPIRAGVIYLAARCDSPAEFRTFQRRVADLKIEQSTEGNAWRAKLVDGETTLEAGLDLASGAILARKINGEEYQPQTFRVNDRDLAAEFLAGW